MAFSDAFFLGAIRVKTVISPIFFLTMNGHTSILVKNIFHDVQSEVEGEIKLRLYLTTQEMHFDTYHLKG